MYFLLINKSEKFKIEMAIRRKKNFPEKKNFSTLNKNILLNIGPNFMQQNSKACKKLFRI